LKPVFGPNLKVAHNQKVLLEYTAAGTFIKAQKSSPSGDARLLHLHFQISANTIRPAWPIRSENRAFSMMHKEQSKMSRTG
jgi:hypothetical protein